MIKRNTHTQNTIKMKLINKKTTYRDGATITTDRINGKYIATIRYAGGDCETVKATFSTLLKAKVETAIKDHYSAMIKDLAQTARAINANARK